MNNRNVSEEYEYEFTSFRELSPEREIPKLN